MEFYEHLQALGVRNLRLGLKENPARTKRLTVPSDSEFKSWKIIEHYNGICPAQTQYLDSCESEATCNLIEWWIWKKTGFKISLDAQVVYRHARRLMYDGTLEGGLLLGDSSKALIDMGILPANTKIKRIPPKGDYILEALKLSPIVTGHRIWDGWMPGNLNRDNGCIDESQDGEYGMGHATLCVGTNLHNNQKLFVHLNSWGPFPPTRGLFAMTAKYSCQNMLDDALQLDIPAGWEKSDSWAKIIMPHPED